MDIFNSIITVAISVITGCFSAKLAYANEIKKAVYEERWGLYVDLISIVEELQHCPDLIYDDGKYVNHLLRVKSKSNLFASKDVLEHADTFFNRVINTRKEYLDYTEAAEREMENRILLAGESDEESKEEIERDVLLNIEVYKDQHIIAEKDILEFIKVLTKIIRSELKTK